MQSNRPVMLCLMISVWMWCVCCSEDVAKATEANLSLGGRKLLTAVAERRVLKQKGSTCNSGYTAACSQ